MVVSRQFDYLDRLLQVSSVPQGANQFPWVQGYGLNAANVDHAVSTDLRFTYDARNRLSTSGSPRYNNAR
jgi:hypothetical protein